LAKGRRAGVQVDEGPGLVDELWPLVEANLAERHGARPVHTVDEMHLLMDLFPAEISVVVARRELEPVAGVVLFETPRVVHVQYIASNPDGNSVGALDAVFDHCLARAAGKGARFFDFGTSNGGPGGALNEGLYEFKAQFGGGGVAYEAYDLELTR
jgi:lipid II:glycine glycyltransferase (peptidoglycan interpeptide bridge formation enzyme)